MTREEAQQKPNLVMSKLLLGMTDNLTNEVLTALKDDASNEFCEEMLNQLYLDSDYSQENEESIAIFKDKVFEALKQCFSTKELKILLKSNEDSANYHLMYKTLSGYFNSLLESLGKTKPSLFPQLNDVETYAIIFNEMKNNTIGFAPTNPNAKKFKDAGDRKTTDYETIQEKYIK